MDTKAYISSGIIEQYALGVLPKEESAILECIMKHNAEVENAVLEAQRTMESFSELQAVEPPSFLKNQIAAQLDFTQPSQESSNRPDILPASNNVVEDEARVSNLDTSKTPYWWAAVASLLLLISLGWHFFSVSNLSTEKKYLVENNKQLQSQLADAKLESNLILTAKKVELKGVEKHSDMLANVYWDSSNKVYLQIGNLPKAPEGKQYQFWAIVDGKPVNAGLYDDNKAQNMQLMTVVKNVQAFAITLEKKGGSATPTMEEMYVMGTV